MDDINCSIYYNKELDDTREARLVINKDNPLDFEKYLAIEYRTGGNKLVNSYYICEFVDFDYNLYDIYRNEDIPKDIGRMLMKSLAQVLSKMHENDIFHGDLQPNNIFFKDIIERNPKKYLIDFNRVKKMPISKSTYLKARTFIGYVLKVIIKSFF